MLMNDKIILKHYLSNPNLYYEKEHCHCFQILTQKVLAVFATLQACFVLVSIPSKHQPSFTKISICIIWLTDWFLQVIQGFN